jgi:hypothetical protein
MKGEKTKMKTIQTEIKLYEYEELSKDAKDKAFAEHEDFLRWHPAEYEEEDEAGNIITKYDNMDEWIEEEIKEHVEESIRINEYLFFENGEMAHITHFVGEHEKAGTTEFYFNGKTYII